MRMDECVDWDGGGCVSPSVLLLLCECLSDLNEGENGDCEWGI